MSVRPTNVMVDTVVSADGGTRTRTRIDNAAKAARTGHGAHARGLLQAKFLRRRELCSENAVALPRNS